MKIYRVTDRIEVKIGDVTFLVSPFTYEQKVELYSNLVREEGVEKMSQSEVAAKAVQYSVKEVKGLEYWDGEEVVLKHENGILTSDSMSELIQLESNNLLASTCVRLLTELVDPKIKGVEVKLPESKIKKK